jgi:hypothetical protein
MVCRKLSIKIRATKQTAGARSPRVQAKLVRLKRVKRTQLITQIVGGKPSDATSEQAAQRAQRT